MFRKTKSLIATLSLLTLLVGCGGNGESVDEADSGPNKSTTISFFGWGSAQEQENFQTLIDQFMVDNPDVKVAYSATDSGNYMTTLKNKGNSLPDVFYMPDYDFLQWADSGRLLDISSYVTDEELNSVWDLSTSMYRYDKDAYTLGKGSLYGLPKDLGPYPLVYNKTLLKKIIEEKNLSISLPDKENPMTFTEFRNYLKAITGDYNGKNVYGIGYYEMMAAVYSNNADYFDATRKKETISSKNFIDAIQFVADLSVKDKTAPTANEQSSSNSFQRFLNQGCVFTFMGPWDCKQFWEDINFEFDIVPCPVGEAAGSKSTSWVGSVAYCVSNKTKKKDAAIRLAKYLALSEKSNQMNYQLGQAIPNMKQMAEGDYVNGVGLSGRQLLPENRKLFVDIVKGTDKVQGHNRVKYYAYDNTFIDDLEDNLSDVFQGNQTAEAFLKGYAAKYQKGLDESNENMN